MQSIIQQLANRYNNKNIYDEKIVKKLKSYNGKDSHYNSNYYELEDGTVIHEDFDEFYEEGRLTLHKFEGKEYSGEYVGYTDRDNTLHFTDVEYT